MARLDLGILFILGIGIIGGLIGGWFFRKVHVPQVVGYIIIGLLVGESGIRLVASSDVKLLQPFNLFALGIIGFLVGGELKTEHFKRYGRQFFSILFGEGLSAFLLVGLATSMLVYAVCGSIAVSAAVGVVFGAIASATDPASTIDVLWEYRSLGIVTTSIIAIVALDDALAMILYGLGTGTAELLTSHGQSILKRLAEVSWGLLGALLFGLVFALVLVVVLRKTYEAEKALACALGLILLLISGAVYLGMDVILAAMSLGFVLTNVVPQKSKELFKVMRGLSAPVYVLFFVLVGARISIFQMPGWLWAIVLAYVLCRTAGKMTGSYFGARVAKGEKVVQRYLGMGLLAQGGVAIGLSIMASEHLGNITIGNNMQVGQAIVFVVTATTLILQLAGPPMVKLMAQLSGETGRNITREDIIARWTVKDIMEKDFVCIREDESLADAICTMADNDHVVYPVVDREGKMVGTCSLEGVKGVITDQHSWRWLVVSDAMNAVTTKAFLSSALKEVLNTMYESGIEQMPVFKDGDGDRPVGLLDMTKIRNRIEKEVLQRQQPALKQRSRRSDLSN